MNYKAISKSIDIHRRLINIRHGVQRSYSSGQPKPFESIPGLSSVPVLGTLHHFLPVIGSIGSNLNLVQTFQVLNERYGSVVKMDGSFSKPSMLLLFEPELYEQVFRAEESNPIRPGLEALAYYREQLRKSTLKGVTGLTASQGDSWRSFRTKVNPALLKIKLLKLYAPALEEISKEMVDRLIRLHREGDYLKENFDREVINWALESVAFIGMDTRLDCLTDKLGPDNPSKKLMKCATDILDLSFSLETLPTTMWKKYPTKTLKKLVEAFDLQWQISSQYVEEAEKRINERGYDVPEEEKTIVERLLAVDKTVAIMMATEMLLAGVDTVSFTLISLLYDLAMNPEKQEKLREGLFAEKPSKRYLRACMKESLRLSPVVAINVRRTGKEHVVAGYHVPKGIDVIAPNEILTNSDKFFPRAKEFLPERWLVDKSDPLYYGNAHPMTSSPFGFGIRSCIGRRIAELEIETFVEKLLRSIKVKWEGPPLEVTTRIMKVHIKPFGFKFEVIPNRI
ncbi:cytochrome P450 CYP12A2 isoform X1 [Amyelois transitella]|uniref:cytochrome P450 CYP12A2 isoform X1 n=1 Tax=Amyelois transitella TaxID=680683 RepID=UPI0029900DAA|nr:cytochrome P450 CYP12A2 isoform X1 [Amyelois transitella]